MITGPFKVSRAFSEGWKLTKQHWLVMIGLYLGFTILTLLLGLFQGSEVTSVRYWVFTIITLAISFIFQAGYTKMYLVASEGEEPEFNLFGKCIKKVFPLFILSIIVGLGTVIGFCLLIVPGIWFALRFGFSSYVLLDNEECGVIEAMKKSYALTAGHFWPILGMSLLFILVLLGGVIALIVGVFLAMVIISFTWTAAYRMLQNEKQETVSIESAQAE